MTTSSFGASLPVGLATTLPASRPLPSGSPLASGSRSLASVPPGSRATTPLLLAVGLLLGAVLLAPEQPLDQEAICHRHNGVEACRVW
ncbi:serine protease inhibitor [Synechococcus sp. CS-1332]|uniref:serine protease inhibitor n=1 Tax=Synechococcus sp. CS-1332 TaxID=2847972 RepID=UPI00223BAB55|nr:serine protease inhibitor [Synechococcus sp. CS-1332]MCT0208987.1 serine protease inhibitor [Synechococcus sp. CS-1332]